MVHSHIHHVQDVVGILLHPSPQRKMCYTACSSSAPSHAAVFWPGGTLHRHSDSQLREFNDKMKVWAPEQMHRLGFRHRPEYIRDREAMRGMTYDEEVSGGAVAPAL